MGSPVNDPRLAPRPRTSAHQGDRAGRKHLRKTIHSPPHAAALETTPNNRDIIGPAIHAQRNPPLRSVLRLNLAGQFGL